MRQAKFPARARVANNFLEFCGSALEPPQVDSGLAPSLVLSFISLSSLTYISSRVLWL